MRILVDYRPALRSRTGVGEHIHGLAQAYTAANTDEVAICSSSWKDGLSPSVAVEVRALAIDRRIPVRVLNYLWHRAEWPQIETLAGKSDAVHAAHPLLIPAHDEWAIAQGRSGLGRARHFTWRGTAETVRQAYLDAIAHRQAP